MRLFIFLTVFGAVNLCTAEGADKDSSPIPAPGQAAQVENKRLGAVLKKGDRGVEVIKLLPNSQAAAAGINEGDVLTRLNGAPVKTPADVDKQLGPDDGNLRLDVEIDTPGGGQKNITVQREGDNVRSSVQIRGKGGGAARIQINPGGRIIVGPDDLNRDPFQLQQDLFQQQQDRLNQIFQRLQPNVLRRQPFGLNNMGPWLGVQLHDLTPQLAEFFGAGEGAVLIETVAPDSPAASAGIQAGDVLTKIDGLAAAGRAALIRQIRRADPGSEMSLTLLRKGEERTVQAKLAMPPNSEEGVQQRFEEGGGKLPEEFSGFSGTLGGWVVGKEDKGFLLKVNEVKADAASKAAKAESVKDRLISVVVPDGSDFTFSVGAPITFEAIEEDGELRVR